jgi:aminoglycoside N3'-acetyltransferase
MANLNERDFCDILEATLPQDDDTFAIFSGIWTFASQFGWPIGEAGGRLLEIIDNFVGPDRTLVFPAYSLSAFPRDKVFDLTLSKPDTGILPECALRNRAFRRSPSPIHSYVVRGPRTDELLARPCTTLWGPDSVLAWMLEADIRVCVLGVPWVSCSLLHYAEETLQVPYRFYKRFTGELKDDGRNLSPCSQVMYVRSLVTPPVWDLSGLGSALSDAGVVLKSPHRRVAMESAKATAFHRVNEGILAANPYAYHSNAKEVHAWVENGKAEEMAALSPDERWHPGNPKNS